MLALDVVNNIHCTVGLAANFDGDFLVQTLISEFWKRARINLFLRLQIAIPAAQLLLQGLNWISHRVIRANHMSYVG